MYETQFGHTAIGGTFPTYIVAEIGINHNGSLATAMEMIALAAEAGVDEVKFQKREPFFAVPKEMWNIPKETPWGIMPYIEYKRKLELDYSDYDRIAEYCEDIGIDWSVSVWDELSAEAMILDYDLPWIKVPSAKITDINLLHTITELYHGPIIMSTGMSTPFDIDMAHSCLSLGNDVVVMHCTSIYPCPIDKINLRMIPVLKEAFGVVGYSGHEVGLATTVAAVVMGASVIERHFTLDRSMWGTDQAASIEPTGMRRLVKDIRAVELAMGTDIKMVYPEERAQIRKLRGEGEHAQTNRRVH